MFGDDSVTSIEDLFNQLSGTRRTSYSNSRAQTQSILNTVESKKESFLIFDLSGKRVISVKVSDGFETNEYGERIHDGGKILEIKFENNEILKYNLPKAFGKRNVSHTFINGILEVSFKK